MPYNSIAKPDQLIGSDFRDFGDLVIKLRLRVSPLETRNQVQLYRNLSRLGYFNPLPLSRLLLGLIGSHFLSQKADPRMRRRHCKHTSQLDIKSLSLATKSVPRQKTATIWQNHNCATARVC